MKQPIDLRPDHARIVHEIIARHLPAGVSVRVFGSRAKWSAKPHSDLDLAVKGKGPLPRSALGDLAEAFSESDLPFRVDVVDWHTVAPSFQAVIDRDGLPLTVPLGQVATLLSGGTPSKANSAFWNGDIPWLTPKDMGQWEGATDAHVTKAAIGKGTRLAPENASFVAVRGMSLHNEIRVVRSARPISFNQDIKAVVAGPTIDPDFLYFALTAAKPVLLGLVSAAGHGTGVLDTDRLRSLEIPALPLDEQRNIAETIGAIDDRIELNRRMNETLERQAQAIFRDWFVDFGPVRRKAAGEADPVAIMGGLTPDPARADELAALFPAAFGDDGLPVGWKRLKLADIATQGKGSVNPQVQPEVAFEHYSLPAFDKGQEPSMDTGSTIKSNKTPVPAGAILLSKLNPEILRVWLPNANSGLAQIASTEFLVFVPKAGASRSLLFALFRDPDFRTLMQGMVTGTSKSHQRISPPALLAQEVIAADSKLFPAFEEFVGVMLERLLESRAESKSLAETRDYLLPRLMSGAVRVAPKVEAA
ncbi:restriction endonuclease subunit S [Sphingobium sp. 15-1]|uniref:restriction endonuclease subunit S n=1 Tax=Sphingobium sp. 15-1 TaxID=2729616 RepID=UPI00159C7FB1|nr:restriction endonuclease subunit S [Sphingobium sp. 15-1]